MSAPALTPAMIPSTQGVRLALHDLGGPDDPTAPVLLFAHATGFHGRVWGPTAAPLTDRYRCLAVDLRGHGVSETPDGASLSWSNLADDVLAVLDSDRIGSEREVHGIGHSLGCAALVLGGSRRPGLLRSLWLYEPAIIGPAATAPLGSPAPSGFPDSPQSPNPMADAALRRRATFPSYDEAIANFAKKPPLNELHPDALAAYVRGGFAPQADGSVTLRCSPATEAEFFRGAGNNEAFEALSMLDAPVALVAGRPDEYGPVTFVPANLAQLRGDAGGASPSRSLRAARGPAGHGPRHCDWVEANR